MRNVADHIRLHAQERPAQPALIAPEGPNWTSVTFKDLDRKIDLFAQGFRAQGLQKGDRVLFLVRPGIQFYAALFGLFRMGAIPVLMDPGMGRDALLQCIQQAAPRAIIGIPIVHVLRLLKPKYFKSAEIFITAGVRWFWGGATLEQCGRGSSAHANATNQDASPEDEGFIAFTSGSTGPPKGVSYVQRMFLAQAAALATQYGLNPQVTTVECFAAFVIFDLAIGMTVVLPDIDMSKPAQAAPEKIVHAIEHHKAQTAFASPVIWENVSRWCERHDKTLPSLTQVLTAGAPIPGDLHRRFTSILPDGVELHTPYGATEALPLTTISSGEVLDDTWLMTTKGAGTCVGRPFPGVDIRFTRVDAGPLPEWSESAAVAEGELGEITVFAPVVSPEYKDRPEANAAAKTRWSGGIGHRMGDLGYRDEQGRVWFCGRKSHALWVDPSHIEAAGVRSDGLVPAVPIEGIFNAHPSVRRCALVGMGEKGSQIPLLWVELENGETWSASLAQELTALAAGTQWEGVVQRIEAHPGFPVDPRHNSKIKRGELASEATTKFAGQTGNRGVQ